MKKSVWIAAESEWSAEALAPLHLPRAPLLPWQLGPVFFFVDNVSFPPHGFQGRNSNHFIAIAATSHFLILEKRVPNKFMWITSYVANEIMWLMSLCG